MKYFWSCLISFIIVVPTIAQKTTKPIEYTKKDVGFKLLDSLHLPLKSDTVYFRLQGKRDTTVIYEPSQSLMYKMVNNTRKKIRFELGVVKEEYIPSSGWTLIEKPNYNKESTVVEGKIDPHFDIKKAWTPVGSGEKKCAGMSIKMHEIEAFVPNHKYRIVKYFHFEGEDQKYYIWDELVVKEKIQ